MPVLTRLHDGVLEVIVSGDFTPRELWQTGTTALQSDELPKSVAVLLDMSGAADLEGKSEEELRETPSFLLEAGSSVGRLAVLAPPEAALAIEDAADEAGLDARPFGTRAAALVWLRSEASG